MTKAFKRFLTDQKGQALPIVLCVLALGGLTIAGSLNYATTNVNGSRITVEASQGAYAAEAGIENTLWSLLNSVTPPAQLVDSVNQMTVNIETEYTGYYTLYLGEFLEPGGHVEFLDIAGDLVWDSGAGAYRYTITITLLDESIVHINEVGARLPVGYSYQTGSAASFPTNLSTAAPEITTDSNGAFFVRWIFSTPLPKLDNNNPVRTQTFYINGSGSIEGEYTWVIANRTDVFVVSEISGDRYIITAKALRPGDNRTRARIKADVIVTQDKAYILSWQHLTN